MAAKLCNVCNKRRSYTGTGKGMEPASHGSGLCNPCYTEGGWENTHNDYNHDAIAAEVQDKGGDPATYLSETDLEEYTTDMRVCWVCNPSLNKAQAAVKPSVSSKNAGYVRRPQFNHRGHTHPQTPAARRACKTAFWASLTPVVNVSTDPQVAAAMAAWNYSCDAMGKPVKPAATWTVEPGGHVGTGVDKRKVKS